MEWQSFLTADEHCYLTTPERIDLGAYRAWGTERRDCEFVVELDTRPLAVLAESAALGSRVYEFMSIQRPGDILHYLRVQLSSVDDEVTRYVVERIKDTDRFYSHFPHRIPPQDELGIVDLDRYFVGYGDDTPPFVVQWRQHRSGRFWPEKLDALFQLTKKLQDRVRGRTDFLLQQELHLIESHRHLRDYEASIERQNTASQQVQKRAELPDALYEAIARLAKLDTVQSISCPLPDFALWRLLVGEQVRRAQKLGVAPQSAFTLCGPDSGLPVTICAEDWGGAIHIPYEGACEGDLFVLPEWRVFHPERAQQGGSLAGGLGVRDCHYLLTPKDFGELESATRTVVGDWVLYESRLPYNPSDPLRLRTG